jgi:hypothetical protein
MGPAKAGLFLFPPVMHKLSPLTFSVFAGLIFGFKLPCFPNPLHFLNCTEANCTDNEKIYTGYCLPGLRAGGFTWL